MEEQSNIAFLNWVPIHLLKMFLFSVTNRWSTYVYRKSWEQHQQFFLSMQMILD